MSFVIDYKVAVELLIANPSEVSKHVLFGVFCTDLLEYCSFLDEDNVGLLRKISSTRFIPFP